jgi:hypothetical protein
MDLIEPATMEDDDVKQKVSPETVTVLETEGQPLRDDEQKLHMRSILVLVVSAVAVWHEHAMLICTISSGNWAFKLLPDL